MPRAFTSSERRQIRRRLLEVGLELFGTLGPRRTTVSDLCRRAGISKGSFYLFFSAKEELLFTLLEELESELRPPPHAVVPAEGESPKDAVARFIEQQQTAFENTPLLRRLTEPHEMEVLLRGLPPERIAEHARQDEGYLMAIVEHWQELGIARRGDPGTIAGTIKALVVLSLHRELVGPRFEAVNRSLIELVSRDLTGEVDDA